MAPGRKSADHDISIPAKRVAHGLRDFLSMAARQFGPGRGTADFQHTRFSGPRMPPRQILNVDPQCPHDHRQVRVQQARDTDVAQTVK
jgi:hypothetical protein